MCATGAYLQGGFEDNAPPLVILAPPCPFLPSRWGAAKCAWEDASGSRAVVERMRAAERMGGCRASAGSAGGGQASDGEFAPSGGLAGVQESTPCLL